MIEDASHFLWLQQSFQLDLIMLKYLIPLSPLDVGVFCSLPKIIDYPAKITIGVYFKAGTVASHLTSLDMLIHLY